MKLPDKLPVVDETKCTSCGKCIAICPTHVICAKPNYSCSRCMKYCMTMNVPCNPDHYIFCYENCDACGKCIEICPTGAMHWHIVSEQVK
jgi:ferredoxin